jgi:hypothetical protein
MEITGSSNASIYYPYTYYSVTLAIGDCIAVEVFETSVLEKQINKGFGGAKQKLALSALKVLIGSEKIPAGSTVYVRGDAQFEGWAKDVQEIGDIKALLCPISRILFVKYAPVYSWTVPSAGSGDTSVPVTVMGSVPGIQE